MDIQSNQIMKNLYYQRDREMRRIEIYEKKLADAPPTAHPLHLQSTRNTIERSKRLLEDIQIVIHCVEAYQSVSE